MPAVKRFFKKYVQDPTDAAKVIEKVMVEFGPTGQLDRTLIVASVDSLFRTQDIGDNANLAVQNAHERADWLRPYYEAYMRGEEAPVQGTPLSAWAGLRPEQVEVLKLSGLKTVEDVAAMTETHLTSIKLPALREIKGQAQHFLDSADQTRFAAKLAEKDEQVALLKAENMERDEQIRALGEQVKQLAELALGKARDEDEVDPDAVPAEKRRPGRPAKAA
jgi:hypothetical protein